MISRDLMTIRRVLVLASLSFACGGGPSPSSSAPAAPALATTYTTSKLALPGGGPAGVGMDYLLYNPRTNTVWVPAGNTGMVDVIDAATGKLASVTGFVTQEVERRGQKRTVGPSVAVLGAPGTVYVGNRGDSSVCAVDERSLAKGACVTLDASPDGMLFVADHRELWVTTPRDASLRVLDAITLAQKARIALDGSPEGFAADPARHRVYTNLEDKDVTLAIDTASHATLATWPSHCGEDGPHGLRLADPEPILLVACDDKIESLDLAHDGAALGAIAIGEGIDDFEYTAADHRVYAGAAKIGTLTIAQLDAKGGLSRIALVPTSVGARNGVVGKDGRIYLSHSQGSELVVVAPQR
jgi:DNA-binding beta-propeller fold protein YncE